MHLINLAEKQNDKKPLKRSMTGLEIELHIIDNEGNISYKSLNLINEIKKKYPNVAVVKECGLNVIELCCYPHKDANNPAIEIITSLEKIIEVAEKNKLKLYPFSTYPGKIESRITPHPDGRYIIQEKILGAKNFCHATKVTGFHHHYALPKGVFDHKTKSLKILVNSKLKRSLLSSYNFAIAIDPIITLLTQSSPFFEGNMLAKNSRMIVYRGGKKLGYPGVYSNFQQVGALLPYEQTGTDLMKRIKNRHQNWMNAVEKAGVNADIKKLCAYELDSSWNPVKINKHGTLESRGMDMNYLSIILGVSVLIKSSLKKIQREFIEVLPSDIGIKQSFRLRNGILYIPPHTHVRGILQKASAYEGFDNDELHKYTQQFFRFAKSNTPKIYAPLLKQIENMIEERKSISDKIVNFAKENNLMDSKNGISRENARIMALHYSEEFEKDLRRTKAIVEKIRKKHQKSLSAAG
ncbi:MAG: hypothetical protein ABIF85_03195 [Nanoarchaeota archaeon]|nr:hypothetical protein [Nanoarchaeota archaeon]MBU4300215.1 hypothetical protein [Nanoarchaeota archaeon]MBU4451601.1 hypothetical protein [Nanoarchaeota archaeon]MCG2723123.1 hypothetical protein [archaeon]